MKVEDWDINKLIPYARNARKNDLAIPKVKASLKEFGWQQPIVVDREGVVVVGHTRLAAAKELGMTKVPVTIAEDLTQEQIKAYRILDNKTSEFAEWDQELLKLEIADIGDLEIMGCFEFEGIKELEEVKEDDFESQPIDQIKTDIKYGDIIQIGNHRLMCGDSTKLEDVERLMDGKKADLWITDAPYGVSYGDKNDFLNNLDKGNRIQDDIKNDHLLKEDLTPFFEAVAKNAYLVTADNCSYYWFFASGGGLAKINLIALDNAGWFDNHILVWVKNNHVLGRTDYCYKHEPIIYGWKKKGTHLFHGGFNTSVFEFPKPLKNDLHPTMKPLELIAKLIENSSTKNQTIIDTFLGSGSTMVACHQLDRICYGMELETKYCQVIIDRMKKLDPSLEVKVIG